MRKEKNNHLVAMVETIVDSLLKQSPAEQLSTVRGITEVLLDKWEDQIVNDNTDDPSSAYVIALLTTNRGPSGIALHEDELVELIEDLIEDGKISSKIYNVLTLKNEEHLNDNDEYERDMYFKVGRVRYTSLAALVNDLDTLKTRVRPSRHGISYGEFKKAIRTIYDTIIEDHKSKCPFLFE